MAGSNQEQALKLFTVTLAWNPSNSEEGDYSVNVWATDEDAAIRSVAEEMADHPDAGIDEGDDQRRAEFIENIAGAAGTYAAEDVGAGLIATVSEFLAGPSGEMSDEAKKDFEVVKTILARYGAFAG